MLVGNDDFGVVFGVADQVGVALMGLHLVYPHSLLTAHHVAVLFVGTEQLSQSARPILDHLGGQLLQMPSRGAWSQVKLVDVHYSKLVLLDQLETGLKLFLRLLREPTDDICCDGHSRHMLQEVVSHLSELLHCVFPVHLGKDVVVCGLDGDMDEGEDPGVVEEMGD